MKLRLAETYLFLFLVFCGNLFYAQTKTAEEFGFRHIKLYFNDDFLDVLVKSRKGEEQAKKPLFVFCQGSMPVPLIKYDSTRVYSVFPFQTDSLLKDYHLLIISKPGIPVLADVNKLAPLFCYKDSTGMFPKEYSKHNLLSYYVERNIELLKYLLAEPWVASYPLVVAGHSEGSTVAAKMAKDYKKISHLIYAGGNPMGRIMSIVQRSRSEESDTDTTRFGEEEFKYWAEVVKNKKDLNDAHGDTHRATYEFSEPPINYLKKLKIPVLVCYGTKDWSAPFNDYLRVQMIRQKKTNYTFKAYVGAEHNFFPLNKENKPDYSQFKWDDVAADWLNWLRATR